MSSWLAMGRLILLLLAVVPDSNYGEQRNFEDLIGFARDARVLWKFDRILVIR